MAAALKPRSPKSRAPKPPLQKISMLVTEGSETFSYTFMGTWLLGYD